jgi:hypothetical protein
MFARGEALFGPIMLRKQACGVDEISNGWRDKKAPVFRPGPSTLREV